MCRYRVFGITLALASHNRISLGGNGMMSHQPLGFPVADAQRTHAAPTFPTNFILTITFYLFAFCVEIMKGVSCVPF